MIPKMTLKMLSGKTLAAAALLLLSTTVAFGQTRSSLVTVTVSPEMLLTPAVSNVQLAVRLAPSVQAQVWRADACTAAPSNSFLVTQSGRTQIPVATLGNGSMVCAASTDGTLTQSIDLNTGAL
jgi:hypothetical protein